MHKETTFIITAAILLTAAVASALYTINAVNAQSNSTGAGNNTNANASKAKVVTMTNPTTGVTIGKIQKINNTSPGGNMTNATK
jgi:hypothetical protein